MSSNSVSVTSPSSSADSDSNLPEPDIVEHVLVEADDALELVNLRLEGLLPLTESADLGVELVHLAHRGLGQPVRLGFELSLFLLQHIQALAFGLQVVADVVEL